MCIAGNLWKDQLSKFFGRCGVYLRRHQLHPQRRIGSYEGEVESLGGDFMENDCKNWMSNLWGDDGLNKWLRAVDRKQDIQFYLANKATNNPNATTSVRMPTTQKCLSQLLKCVTIPYRCVALYEYRCLCNNYMYNFEQWSFPHNHSMQLGFK